MKKKEFHIGCSGFYNRHWKNIFYPEDMPTKDWLGFYCKHLNTLELNVTFYKFPTIRIMQNWYHKTPEGFLFSVKAPKQITHIKKLVDCKPMIDEFYAVCLEGLKEKLGCILFQLPPSFHYSEERLELLIANLNTKFKNAIEFRHESWWTPVVFVSLRKHNITFCSVSHPTLPESIITTTAIGYIRLHGREKMFYSDYSAERLQAFIEDIHKEKNLKEIFIYFNNTAGVAGILNALEMRKIIGFIR